MRFPNVALALLAASCLLGLAAATSPIRQPRSATADIETDMLYVDPASITPKQSVDPIVTYRLPNNTRPNGYAIHLLTNVHSGDFTFSGTVRIDLTAVQASRNIVVHQRQLAIQSASLVVAATNATVAIGQWQYDERSEQLTVPLTAADLVPGTRYILELSYTGVLRTDNAGFYRSSYRDDQNVTRWLATTQFQTTDARHAFPCYDEPALRATFSIQVTHGSGYHALSNMPVDGEPQRSADGQLTTTRFQTTPLTPTYILAVIVSEFVSITGTNQKGFVQRVFARSNGIGNGHFGLDTGIAVLDAFEEYFQIPFALPKMDQVAVPDFAAGAMENWGLVTYREEALLYNASYDLFSVKATVARLIAHEYLHQWFGNHVTPAWWSYSWLNEGFATLYQFYAIDWVYPEWRFSDQFVFETVQKTLISDAAATTRPMTHYVENPTEVAALFDFVTYGKAGSVLNMLMHAFTESTFKKALIVHLNKGKNSHTTESELITAIGDAVTADSRLPAADLSVADIITSWSRQAGFPILSVHRDYSAPGQVHLQQQRYFADNATAPASSSATWWIPLNFATNASTAARNFDTTAATSWLGAASATLNISAEAQLTGNDQWLLLNKRQTGYYRIQYDERNYRLLADTLRRNLNDIHLTSRAQLVDDLFEFVRTERIDYALVFDVVRYLEAETEAVPWLSAFRGLTELDRLNAGGPQFGAYQRFVADKMLAGVYGSVRVQPSAADEHWFRKQIRPTVVRMACQYGLAECRTEAAAVLRDYLAGNATPHHDHRAEVLCGGVRTATPEQYAQLWQRFRVETEQRERYWLIDALACTANRTLLAELAASSTATVEADGWRTATERYRALYEVMANHAGDGVRVALEHLTANVAAAEQQYTGRYLNSAVVRLSTMVNSAERKELFDKLIAAVGQTSFVSQSIIDTAEQNVRNNLRWVERNQGTLNRWIETNAASSTMVSTLLLAVLLVVGMLL